MFYSEITAVPYIHKSKLLANQIMELLKSKTGLSKGQFHKRAYAENVEINK